MNLSEEQIEFLNKVCDGTWTLNSKGEVDVDGSVNMVNMKLTQIPVKFGKVSGYFDCSHNQLTSLKGSPTSVGGDFRCSNNQLTSLIGNPIFIEGYFYCYNNQLTDYFKNIKEQDFPHWDILYWFDVLKEYPFLVNIGKKYIKDLKEHLNKLPQTKLYLD